MSIPDRGASATQPIELGPDYPCSTAPPALTVQVVGGDPFGAIFVVASPQLVIGRGDEADVVLSDPGMSREHACLWRTGDELTITDLGSTNGTFVEGARLMGPRKLHQGDRIRLGNVTLRYLARCASEVEASQQLCAAAIRDHLTGLFNRAYFDDRLAAEVAYAKRHRSSLACLMADVDDFKSVNDNHGHATGDALLQSLASQVRETVRREDVAARYGGDELAILARGIDPHGARCLAERLREGVARASVAAPGGEPAVRTRLSLGIAVLRPGAGLSSSSELTAAADAALYRAKGLGRDRVVLFDDRPAD